MHRFTLRQLEYLVTVIDTGSIARAAEALNVSQPTISVALSKIEAQLGVQLLLRHQSQGVSPTTQGQRIVSSARNLLADATALQADALEAGQSVTGRLRLGSFLTLSPMVLPELIARLAEEAKGVELDLSEGSQDVLVRDLEEGRLDMALLYDIDLPDTLETVELSALRPYAALPAAHPLAAKGRVALADLVDEAMILLNVSPSRDYFLGLFHDLGLTPKIAYSSPSLELVRGMVGCGLGYALLVTRPEGDRTYSGQEIAVRPLRGSPKMSRMVLARSKSLRLNGVMKHFQEVVRAHFA